MDNDKTMSISMEHTMKLGSYTPRMSDSHSTFSSSESCPSTYKTNAWIGKSLEKNRYSQDTLMYMHSVASSLEKSVLHSLTYPRQGDDPSMPQSWLQLFGYDIYTQEFPQKFVSGSGQGTFPRRMSVRHGGLMNHGTGIRCNLDEFGRAMTDWRKGETMNDTQPFPTKDRC
jgi:hypothetical protein